MAVKFEFTVDDIDAENIMDCIQHEILNCLMTRQDALIAGRTDMQYALEDKIEYYKELKKKMFNTRVPDEN